MDTQNNLHSIISLFYVFIAVFCSFIRIHLFVQNNIMQLYNRAKMKYKAFIDIRLRPGIAMPLAVVG